MEDFVIVNFETNEGLTLSRYDVLDLLLSIDARINYLDWLSIGCRKRKAYSSANELYYKIHKLKELQNSLTKLLD